jgi:hypothetical protein
MPASDTSHLVVLMRQNKSCKQRGGWQRNVRESCVTTIKNSSTIEVGHPLLHNTIFTLQYPVPSGSHTIQNPVHAHISLALCALCDYKDFLELLSIYNISTLTD